MYAPNADPNLIIDDYNLGNIASAADIELLETYEENIDYYQDRDFSVIPIPYSEKYYDINNGELHDLTNRNVSHSHIKLLDVMELFQDIDFLFFDSYGKRIVDQPEGESLPYQLNSSKIQHNGRIYGPREVYYNYSEIKAKIPSEKHDTLLSLTSEGKRYRIVTLTDLNKRPVRILAYRLLMQLETRFGNLVANEFESEELFNNATPSAIGHWKKAQIQGNPTHIVEK